MTPFVKRTDVALGGARTLPGRYFSSPEIFAEEEERIFARRWLCVGRAAELEAAGEYLLQEVGPDSVIVLRDRAGAIRAFHNVCRHRGTRLCEAPRGRLGATIQCPYHGWTWSLDGRLVAAPSAETIENFEPGDWPLHPVASAAWEGFVFINLARDPEPFENAFAPVLTRFSRFRLPRLVPARRTTYDVACNWKLILQNYSECYHCPTVHPPLVKLSPPTSGENDLVSGPFLGGYMEIVEGCESLSLSGRAAGLPVGPLPPEDRHRVYYYSLFPNLLLSLHPDYVMYHAVWPEAPGRTRVVCEWLFAPETLGDARFSPDDAVEFWDQINRQDWHICERAQLGVQSRAYSPGPYSRREGLAAGVDREVLMALGRVAE
ncbi:MAG TPA: aromatic ring-hydroxylating dioxygenase subunit alpha [Gemmatimonadales bacterium]|nr:aromatic ring-hydroxylating dioxygenase subunit alpha [Gemmatimonadales bacterium]